MSNPAERERRNVGQALHDTVCQSLGGIAILVGILARRAKAGGVINPADLEELAVMTNRALAEARALSRDLLPVQLESGGLMSALEELAVETSRTVPCSFICETPVLVGSAPAALALYSRAQEDVRRAMADAGAAAITITLTEEDGEPSVQVRPEAPGSTLPARGA